MPRRTNLPHIDFSLTANSENYKSPNQAPRPRYPQRNRAQHAAQLLTQLRLASQESQNSRQQIIGAPAPTGVFIEFESDPNFELTVKSLDLPSKGIELLNVKTEKVGETEITKASVFVPDEQINKFVKTIEEYRDKSTPSGKPKNSALVDSIRNIRRAVLQSLWTDSPELFPQDDEVIWWEVWLRATHNSVPRFQNYASSKDLHYSKRTLLFPDRHVVLVYAKPSQMNECLDIIDTISEFRRAKECLTDFMEMGHSEQVNWAEALQDLAERVGDPLHAICLLDTGVNRSHPALVDHIDTNHILACNSWATHDHQGHGTAMAGLALYGNLEAALTSTERVPIHASVESVKIIPPSGVNAPELYGAITKEALSRIQIANPEGRRTILMAVTADDYRDRGQPSSWSAAVDEICYGKEVGDKHLFILCAGNVPTDEHSGYPDSNLLNQVKDPGQAWNALTVGAFTDKVEITEADFSDWDALAEAGHLSPSSSTSSTWSGSWPIKPEVVFEGGNAAINADGVVDYPNSLGVLSTYYQTAHRLYTSFADTSAAAAQAAHLSSIIASRYPHYWPETIRGLIVHSAEWNAAMRSFPAVNKTQRERLLRQFGYGVVDTNKAIASTNNILTMVAQQELRPYDKSKMNEMHFYEVPWPAEVLSELGQTTVRMKVTLSYFIEPNPARRGWKHKFRYQSHGLRFDVKTPEESQEQFLTRMNRDYWQDDTRDSVTSSSDTAEWYFGRNARTKGSLHSDVWEGSAASLAERGFIAVVPVVGWWREKHSEGHTTKKARYSLIVTIETPSTDVDLYTPVETLITPVAVNINIDDFV